MKLIKKSAIMISIIYLLCISGGVVFAAETGFNVYSPNAFDNLLQEKKPYTCYKCVIPKGGKSKAIGEVINRKRSNFVVYTDDSNVISLCETGTESDTWMHLYGKNEGHARVIVGSSNRFYELKGSDRKIDSYYFYDIYVSSTATEYSCETTEPPHYHKYQRTGSIYRGSDGEFSTYCCDCDVYRIMTCSCGKSYTSYDYHTDPHNIVKLEKVDPTCTKTGLTAGCYCSQCDKRTVIQQIIPALGHDWETWISELPTYNRKGKRGYYCNRCGEIKYKSIPADKKTYFDNRREEYILIGKVDSKNIKKNLLVADLKKNNKYKVAKFTKKGKKITGGTLIYMGTCNDVAKVTIPDSVKIGGATFKVTSITEGAFYEYNSKLSTVVIGKNIKHIGKESFKECKKLKSITIKSTNLEKIGADAFQDINAKAKIKVPKKKIDKYTNMIIKAGTPSKVKIIK